MPSSLISNPILGGSVVLGAMLLTASSPLVRAQIGAEKAVPYHLQDGQEYQVSLTSLLEHGKKLFVANWTIPDGAGRPLTKGTGSPVADPSNPLVFPHNFNRISGPDANSCAGCHNSPVAGGNGDITANVFVLGQRFDFATFNVGDNVPTKGSMDESGKHANLQEMANNRSTPGMFGSGYIEMLARQMTVDLQTIRDGIAPGGSAALTSKGVSFGTLSRNGDGSWNVSAVEGLPAPSLGSASGKPNLIIRPFHQVSNVVSLRQFTNNAFNHHHGIQSTERFGEGTDPDGDGVTDEMTRADVTAASLFQAVMAVPGRIIPASSAAESAVLAGEEKFVTIGCAVCHTPSLPLTNNGHIFTEPNPFNPAGNMQPDDGPIYSVDLNNDPSLPTPRLRADGSGTTLVPAFTDLKVHDITSGANDPHREPLDQNQALGSPGFFSGNGKFITRKLWGLATKPNFFHHGMLTTIRDAITAHAGEALASKQAFDALSPQDQAALIEFLKSLHNLPEGSPSTTLSSTGQARVWPPHQITQVGTSPEGTDLMLHWQGGTTISPTDRSYQAQTSTDLVNWTDLGPATTDITLTAPMNLPRQFFRIALVGEPAPPTEPTGYVSMGVPAASEATFAAPLIRQRAFRGRIRAISGNQISVTDGPNWGVNAFVKSGPQTNTYAAIVTTGEKAGLVGMITANTSDTVTLWLDPAEDLTGISSDLMDGNGQGAALEIIPYWTPATFASGTPPQGAQILLFRANIAGTSLSASKTLEYDSGHWYDVDDFNVADDVALGFHEGIVMRNPTGAAYNFKVQGDVPTFPQRMSLRTLAAGTDQDIRFGYLCPVPEPIGTLSLNLQNDDALLVFDNTTTGTNKSASKIYLYTTADGWVDGDTFSPVNIADALQPGYGYMLRRKATSPASTLIWQDLPSFLQ
ncbi:MAG: TIGR02597 family protein [Giesbergeria sp.]